LRAVSQRFLTIILSAMVPLLAMAQQDQKLRDRDPDLSGSKKITSDLQQASLHSGAFYLSSRIRLSNAGFSDSIGVPTSEDSEGIGLTVEAPQRLYIVPRKKLIFSIDFVPGYSTFSSGERRNQFNYLGRADAHFLLNHLYLDVYALRADQLRAHIADINRLATTREDETGVAAEVKYSSRTSMLLSARYRDTTYPEDRFQPDLEPDTDFNPIRLLDRNERTFRGSFLHKTFPLTSLFVSSEVSNYGFDVATYKDSRRTFYGAGAAYDSGRTQVRVEAGPVKLDFDDPQQRDYTGISGSIKASRANGRWTYTGAAERDLGFSILNGNNYFTSNTARAGINYVATRRLTLRVNSALERDEYDTPFGGIDRRDTTSFTSVGFAYAFRAVSTGLDVGYYQRDTTVGGDTDSGIRYVVHLSFNP
jgi:hypothetical protein